MKPNSKPQVLVLGGNFAGLTTARFIRERCKDAVQITLVDRKPYLAFIPNIPIEVFANHDPAEALHMPIVRVLERDEIRFVQGEVREIDVKKGWVAYTPTERPGAAMKLAFKEMYYRTGGKIPSWGVPLSELVADTLV